MNELLRRLLALPPQGSTFARGIDTLHFVVIGLSFAGAFVVMMVALFFVLRYRRAGDAEVLARQPPPQTPWWRELTLFAGLFGLFISFWVIGFRQFVHMHVPPEGTLDIDVSAKQWMWEFAYPDGAASNDVLYVPANRPIKLIMSSRDVIHSFYVPAFRIKQDVVPGRTTTVWFQAEPGRYPILCAQYCGTDHSTMRGEVVALSEAEYAAREEHRSDLAGPRLAVPASPSEPTVDPVSLAGQGERVAAQQGCLRCHTLDGTPHIGPTWAGLYGSRIPLEGGGEAVADEAYLTESMMDPLAKVHAGFLPNMPSYQGLLDPSQVGALLELIKTLRTAPETRSPLPVGPLPVEAHP